MESATEKQGTKIVLPLKHVQLDLWMSYHFDDNQVLPINFQ